MKVSKYVFIYLFILGGTCIQLKILNGIHISYGACECSFIFLGHPEWVTISVYQEEVCSLISDVPPQWLELIQGPQGVGAFSGYQAH